MVCGSVRNGKALKRMSPESVEASLQKSFRHWWAEHQGVPLKELTQKIKSLIYHQEISSSTANRFDSGYSYTKEEIQITKSRNYTSGMLSVENGANSLPCSMTMLVAAVESGELHLDDITNMNAATFCRVFMSNIHRTLQREQVRHLKTSVHTWKNYNDWLRQQDHRSEKHR